MLETAMPPAFGKEKTMEYTRLCMGAQEAWALLSCPLVPLMPNSVPYSERKHNIVNRISYKSPPLAGGD